MASDTEARVHDILARLQSLDKARELFSELNYDPSRDLLSRKDWNKSATDALAEDPQVIACHDDFKIIYAHLNSDRLLLGDERPVVNRLLQEHPYLLCLFSNRQQQQWHFVNIKYDEDIKRRRLFRRITVGPDERLRTATERLTILDLETISADLFGLSPLAIQARHDEAFDVEAVTKQFFDEYKAIFRILEDDLCKQTKDRPWSHDYSLQLLNRCMFIYFVQRKGWLGNDRDFFLSFWESYQRSAQSQNSFVDNWLRVLFFEAFCNKPTSYHNYFPTEIREALALAPYLNGGLFTENKLDQDHKVAITDRRFEQILKFLERYNFTIAEDSPLDKEVAVAPEMIGKVYESLVNVSEEVDERGEAGIFYTPRTEIELMCRLSLVDHLANHLGEERKDLLYQLIFALEPDENTDADRAVADANLWSILNERLHDITVLDPACGSGSFLVGMLNILDDLQERANRQLGVAEAPYERKKRIIGQSLYGVDVMEWACHVAELRLWLALIIDADFTREELHIRQEPLLPHFSFKVRCGDSLVQEVGGINLGHITASQEIPPLLKARITSLKNEKLKFYNNDTTCKFHSVDALKNEERRLFADILDARQHRIQERIKDLRRRLEGPRESQIRLDGTVTSRSHQMDLETNKYRQEIEALTAELAQTEASRKALSTAKEVPFVWDIAFVEIFESERDGFDIVIGNPPYVRQEAIADPHVPRDKVTPENKRAYKDKLARSVYQAFPRFFGYKAGSNTVAHKIDAKSDLYIYFYLHGLSLLNGKGSFCFITSNSWLDANYGADLQEFLLKHSHVKMVLDNQVRRTFANADVNSIIVLFSAPDDRREWALEKTARFVMFRVPFEHILSPVIFDEIEEATERKATKEYRIYPIQQGKLLEDGCEIPEQEETGKAAGPLIKTTRYIGNKWGGKYLRAPDIFIGLAEATRGHTVSLGQLVRGQRYLNTGGANGFFIITKFVFSSDGIHYLITNTSKEGKEDGNPQFLIEREYTHPIIRSSDLSTLWLTESHADALVIDIPPDESTMRHTKVLEYVRWGERKGFNKRSVTSLQRPWWKAPIQARESGPLLWLRYHHNVHRAYYNPQMLIGADAFYRLYPFDDSKTLPLAAILNSTYMALWKEILGAVGYGLGVLGTRMDSMLRVPIPILNDSGFCQQLTEAFKTLAFRIIGPIEHERAQLDRRALDDLVFCCFGLSTQERDAVYEAVINLVEARLKKAGSV